MNLYVIRHKSTGKHFVARSGKGGWKSKSAAKSARANTWHTIYYTNDEEVLNYCNQALVSPIQLPEKKLRQYFPNLTTKFPYFNEQSEWDVVELSGDISVDLKTAKDLLAQCLESLQSTSQFQLHDKIQEFIK